MSEQDLYSITVCERRITHTAMHSNMREKRKADPLPAQARLKPYNSSPTPYPDSLLLLWAKQHSLYSSLCINVVREVAAYLSLHYLVGIYRGKPFGVNMTTCQTYLYPDKIIKGNSIDFFQDQNWALLMSNGNMLLLELSSHAITKLPPYKSSNRFSYMRLYTECVYGYINPIEICQGSGTIERLHRKSGLWLASIKGLGDTERIMSEVVYKDWWVFFLSGGSMEWFSFENGRFREPTIQLTLPDFTFMGKIAEGKFVCIGEKSKVFKVDIEKLTVEILKTPKQPWVRPNSLAHMVQGDVIYWVDQRAFRLRSLNFTTMKKTSRRLLDNLVTSLY